MILIIQNLTWETESPSHYKLAPDHVMPGCNLDISFLGDNWFLFLDHNGHVSTQCFDNRDSAIGMVAQAFQREGVI